ncbi:MAG: hypothetical protein SGCHY_002652 [Lobulomycetales sp.]
MAAVAGENIQVIRFRDTELFAKAFEIRRKVFVQEQGIPESLELDEHDLKSTHFVHFEGEKAVGTLRILPASSHGHVAKIGRLAVLKSARNNGTGRALMESAHSYLRKTRPEVKEVVIHAQTAVLGFYKGLGIRKFEKSQHKHFNCATATRMEDIWQVLIIVLPGAVSFLAVSFALLSIWVFDTDAKLAGKLRKAIGGKKLELLTPPEKAELALDFTLEENSSEWAVTGLLIADFTKSVGASFSFVYLFHGLEQSSLICRLQGNMLGWASVSSAFWNLAIAVFSVNVIGNTNTTSAGSKNPGKMARIIVFLLCSGGPALLSGLLHLYKAEPFSESEIGAYCMISPDLDDQRFYHHFLQIAWSSVVSFMLYIFAIFKVNELKNNVGLEQAAFSEQRARNLRNAMARLAFHASSIMILSMPIATARILQYFGYDVSDLALRISFGIFMLTGFFNSLIFLIKKDIWRRYLNLFGFIRKDPGAAKAGQRESVASPFFRRSVSSHRSTESGTIGRTNSRDIYTEIQTYGVDGTKESKNENFSHLSYSSRPSYYPNSSLYSASECETSPFKSRT